MRIILADDDLRFIESLQTALREEHEVQICEDLKSLKSMMTKKPVDLLICDYDFGHENLESFLQVKPPQIPILVLTGKATRQNIIDLLNLGVSGLLEKPVGLSDLRSRILKIKGHKSQSHERALGVLGFRFEPESRTVFIGGRTETLTPIEFKIVDFFLSHCDKEIRRADLQKYLWPEVNVAKNTLDTHLGNIKKKLPVLHQRLVTVYGGTYILKLDE
jgi:DNA-binding response OmpR family regulator